MDELHYILLHLTKKFAGDRTIYGMYHLLKGKKSSQTMQDANMYSVTNLFKVLPSLKREEIEKHISYLVQHQFIESSSERSYVITERGESRLLTYQQETPFPTGLHGQLYGARSVVFWRRLSLLIQTVSHVKRREKVFQPIIQEYETTMWVKSFLLHSGYGRDELAQMLHDECLILLDLQGESAAELFVLRLTGYDRVGLTEEQVATIIGCDEWRGRILFQHVLHNMIRSIDEREDCPLLRKICPGKEEGSYSISAKATYELLQHGMTLADISKKRNVKQNTVEDHLVEIALHEEAFKIDSFVSEEKQHRIRSVYRTRNTKKLRLLREEIGQDVTYFEIRLVLAKVGEK